MYYAEKEVHMRKMSARKEVRKNLKFGTKRWFVQRIEAETSHKVKSIGYENKFSSLL